MKFNLCDICGEHIDKPAGKLILDYRNAGNIGGRFVTFLSCETCKPKMIDSQSKIREFMVEHLKSLKTENNNLENKSE